MMKLFVGFFLLCSSLSAVFAASHSLQTHRYARSSGKCNNFVDSPFGVCSAAGYNETFEFPENLTGRKLQIAAKGVRRLLFRIMQNCSQRTLAITMSCSYLVPQCSKGDRVYPCKRVCNEFLKQCEKSVPAFLLDYVIAICHILPNANASSGKCHEPPNFTTNDSIPGPLDRNCSRLVIPAFKNLGVSSYTFVSVEQQKKLYNVAYRKGYEEGNLDTNFPPWIQKVLEKYPRCQDNLKKLYHGEYLPPCFPGDELSAEGHGFYIICQSTCDEIARDCPNFFRDDFPELDYCSFAGKENSSHGFCRRNDWPTPFAWTRLMLGSTEKPSVTTVPSPTVPSPTVPSPKSEGTKVWIIAVAVVVSLVIVILIVGGALWWKWRHIPTQSGYKKQEEDTAPLEGAMEL